jgi:glycosyltransferase involved in cell wall biosynthesis
VITPAATPVTTARSAAWDTAPAPAVTVVVSTYRRAAFLPGLLAALEAQQGAPPFELVVADNGSDDDTWRVLLELVAATPLAVTALRLPENLGPGPARNRCTAHSRAPLLALTDDDCLPAPAWLAALVAAFDGENVVIVQGRTLPESDDAPGPWARSVWVTAPSPWFETCNVGYRRIAYGVVGGFDEDDALLARASGGRPFGEDAWLGGRVLTATRGRAGWAPDALVRHRWLPGSFRDHVGERRHMRDFPALARRLPAVADSCWAGVFLSRRTAAVDLAVVSAVAAVVTRRPALLVGAVPWLRTAWTPARARRGALPLRLVQAAVADLAGLAALVEGSVRHRRLVL